MFTAADVVGAMQAVGVGSDAWRAMRPSQKAAAAARVVRETPLGAKLREAVPGRPREARRQVVGWIDGVVGTG